MTQLRQRMIEDMQLRKYSKVTVRRYVECVAAFARFFGRCPSGMGPEEIRAFQVHLVFEPRHDAPHPPVRSLHAKNLVGALHDFCSTLTCHV